jgi:hypothetical protein
MPPPTGVWVASKLPCRLPVAVLHEGLGRKSRLVPTVPSSGRGAIHGPGSPDTPRLAIVSSCSCATKVT